MYAWVSNRLLPRISGAGSMKMLGLEFFLDPGQEETGDRCWFGGVHMKIEPLDWERLRLHSNRQKISLASTYAYIQYVLHTFCISVVKYMHGHKKSSEF